MRHRILSIACSIWLVASIAGCGLVGWFADRSVTVAKQQLDPAELLRKYELFKDQSAALDAKLADIHITAAKIRGVQSGALDRVSREQLMLWEQELAGLKFSYNDLAAQYNAEMVKINYRFCNVGDLPPGADTPLPRAYKPYQEE